MKLLKFFSALLLMAAFFSSCSKEQNTQNAEELPLSTPTEVVFPTTFEGTQAANRSEVTYYYNMNAFTIPAIVTVKVYKNNSLYATYAPVYVNANASIGFGFTADNEYEYRMDVTVQRQSHVSPGTYFGWAVGCGGGLFAPGYRGIPSLASITWYACE